MQEEDTLKLVEFVPPTPHPLWKLCPQMGITDVIVKVNPDLTGLPDPWKYDTLASIVSRLKAAGLAVVGLEGDPFDMTPIKEFGERGTGNGKRGTGRGAGALPRAAGVDGKVGNKAPLLQLHGRQGVVADRRA